MTFRTFPTLSGFRIIRTGRDSFKRRWSRENRLRNDTGTVVNGCDHSSKTESWLTWLGRNLRYIASKRFWRHPNFHMGKVVGECARNVWNASIRPPAQMNAKHVNAIWSQPFFYGINVGVIESPVHTIRPRRATDLENGGYGRHALHEARRMLGVEGVIRLEPQSFSNLIFSRYGSKPFGVWRRNMSEAFWVG